MGYWNKLEKVVLISWGRIFSNLIEPHKFQPLGIFIGLTRKIDFEGRNRMQMQGAMN